MIRKRNIRNIGHCDRAVMVSKAILITIIISFLLTACAGQSVEGLDGELTKINLPMGYIPNVQYAPFYVADDLGYFAEQGLEIDFNYQTEIDGTNLVGAGENPFALVSGEQVLLARAQGIPVVNILGWWQDYPVALAVSSQSGIRELADLKGKKIGLPGPYGASYVGLRALLNAAGLQESDVTLDSIGYNQVEALISGRDDAVVVYANNEPVQLKSIGYQAQIFPVKDYVNLSSNGVITNEKTIAENPELVRRFNQAVLQGLQDTLEDPGMAFNVSKKYIEGLQESDWMTQYQVLLNSIEYWKAKELGASNPQAWENMQAVLLDMGLLKKPLDLSKAFTNEFIR